MGGLLKAARLEFNQIKAAKANLLLSLLVPILVVLVFWVASSSTLDQWLLEQIRVDNATYFDFYGPMIFSVLAFFITSQLTVLRIVGERSPYGTLDRDLLAIPRTSFYVGKLLTNSAIALIQSLVITSSALLLGVLNRGNPVSMGISLFLVALVGVNVGLLFSVFSKTKEQAVQLIPFALLLFLILSGGIIDFTLMPSTVAGIARLTPLAQSVDALSGIMFAGKTLAGVANSLMGLLAWSMALFIIGLIKFNTEN